MTVERWTDAMLDKLGSDVAALLEGQRLIVQIYQQEHDARVEDRRRFNAFIERQERLNEEQQRINQEQQRINQEQQRINQTLQQTLQRLEISIARIEEHLRFSRENGHRNGAE
ncbi:hypothetical protein [Thermostichus vulcanus]|uniref:Uncharacterized protein n=1 Tax=Thermostichus vulcanus str. 'Rupite' TaxID=2813851 RepID=A0ABT0CCF2_THEVL|nr:hypothetical protein [Thermostichus vulcanus]MCJ2543473.1 hypothetical protein [Thermostichus vulcanus str. 'Rupite']